MQALFMLAQANAEKPGIIVAVLAGIALIAAIALSWLATAQGIGAMLALLGGVLWFVRQSGSKSSRTSGPSGKLEVEQGEGAVEAPTKPRWRVALETSGGLVELCMIVAGTILVILSML